MRNRQMKIGVVYYRYCIIRERALTRKKSNGKDKDSMMNMKKEMAESHHRVPITEEVRKALREKRLRFGMSNSGAGEFIGVHWSTYRKWETGETTQYTREIERRVQCFLTEEKPSLATLDEHEKASRMMDKLIHRLRNTYRLCQRQPRLQERLVVRLEGLIDEILSIYSQNP